MICQKKTFIFQNLSVYTHIGSFVKLSNVLFICSAYKKIIPLCHLPFSQLVCASALLCGIRSAVTSCKNDKHLWQMKASFVLGKRFQMALGIFHLAGKAKTAQIFMYIFMKLWICLFWIIALEYGFKVSLYVWWVSFIYIISVRRTLCTCSW